MDRASALDLAGAETRFMTHTPDVGGASKAIERVVTLTPRTGPDPAQRTGLNGS